LTKISWSCYIYVLSWTGTENSVFFHLTSSRDGFAGMAKKISFSNAAGPPILLLNKTRQFQPPDRLEKLVA